MPDIISDSISDFLSDPTVTAVGAAMAAALVALWLAAAWWAYSDAGRRTDSTLAALVAAGWIIVSTPLLVPFALAIYSFARPQQTAAEGRTRHLAAELVDEMGSSAGPGCPACGTPSDPSWLRCPACATWLASPCAGCGSWSTPTLSLCPFCGSEDRMEPAVEMLEPEGYGYGRFRRMRRTRVVGPGRAGRGTGRRSLVTADGRPLAPVRSR
jgi:hypothetical protein